MEANTGISSILRNPWLIAVVVALVVGAALGVVYAWVINPVQATETWAYNLTATQKAYYLQSVTRDWQAAADRTTATNQAWTRLCGRSAELLAFAKESKNIPESERLTVEAMLEAVQTKEKLEGDCTGAKTGGGQNSLLGTVQTCALPCLIGLVVLAAVVGAGWYVSSRRKYVPYGQTQAPVAVTEAEATAAWGKTAPPVAQFTSKYIGTDVGYDDSFSIDTAAGNFLGECGVGVSETIGTGDPKKITALEVWLFDKNDIRTVTKVLMSEHSFYDDALRAKLAPKGEAILAKVGETVLLETATLEISARVVELEYGSAPNLPPNSFLSKITIELAAWAKETVPAEPQP
jgi:hypothetical protein